MYSNLVPFENIVDAVKDGTGITNTRNLLPQIRRLIHRSQREIGYGGSLLLKRIKYQISDGTISVDENNNYKVRLPEDLVSIEEIGMCHEGLCPEHYRHQGNYLFLCHPIESFSLIYYAFICDGNGNPTVSENHFEAVVAGISFFLYQPKIWNGEGNMSLFKHLERYYEDRIGEARGMDVFPNTKKEWAQISERLRMSQRDMLIYSITEACYCCIPKSNNSEVLEEEDTSDDMVYYWQYNDLVSNISLAPTIDQAFLDAQNSDTIDVFTNGTIIPYNFVGRIGFAIKNIPEDYYQIYDVLGNDITNIVFDKYYDSTNKIQIFISKEFYSHGNIYYKLIHI